MWVCWCVYTHVCLHAPQLPCLCTIPTQTPSPHYTTRIPPHVFHHTYSPTQQCDWWTGATLFNVLDNVEPPARDPLDSFRMPIIDRYRDMGTIIMGKSEAGVVKKGDTLLIMPNRYVWGGVGWGRLVGWCRAHTHTCLYDTHTCLYETHTCLYDTHTCLYDTHTCLYDTHTCLYDTQTCLYDTHTCLYDTHTCLY